MQEDHLVPRFQSGFACLLSIPLYFLTLLPASAQIQDPVGIRVMQRGPVYIYSDKNPNWRESGAADYVLNEGDAIEILPKGDAAIPSFVPSFATAFRYVDLTSGRKSQSVYYVSNRLLIDNSQQFPQSPKKEIEEVVKNPENCPPADSRSDQSKGAGQTPQEPKGEQVAVSKDASWTYRALEDYVMGNVFLKEGEKADIRPRSEWGAAPTQEDRALNPPVRIVLHHEGGTFQNRSSSRIREVQRMHQETNGWRDIGYHYVIAFDENDKKWKIYEGLPKGKNSKGEVLLRGTHARDYNNDSIGVAIIGNFSPYHKDFNPLGYPASTPQNERQPPKEAVEQLAKLVQQLKSEHPTITDLTTHGSDSTHYRHGRYPVSRLPNAQKECPGEGCIHLAGALKQKFFAPKEKEKESK